MKYNLTPELLSCQTEPTAWLNQYDKNTDQANTTEFYPPALFIEGCQTLDEDFDFPSSQLDIKYVYSRKFRPYSFLMQKWNCLNLKNVGGGTLNTKTFDCNECGGSVESDVISVQSIMDTDGYIVDIDTEEVDAGSISSKVAIISDLSGSCISSYGSACFQDISALGTAALTAMAARWADLAELYQADQKYDPGTLVEFSGPNELTIAKTNANGCVSEKPAVILNYRTQINSIPLVLTGRTRVKVIGSINKFDKLELSDVPGIATKRVNKTIIGIALESNQDENIKMVDSIVKLTI